MERLSAPLAGRPADEPSMQILYNPLYDRDLSLPVLEQCRAVIGSSE